MPVRREQVAAALKYLGDRADLRGRAERALSLDPQEQDIADIAVETGASFIPGVGQALAARDVERARRANDPAGMAMASMGAIPGGRLAKLLKGFDPTRLELDVYHGTPHRFPATEANPLGEFDASKIGTGEGAQAYGHGIYYAENPNVAKGYQSSLSADRGFSFEGKTGLTRAEVQDMVNAKYGKGYLDNILRPSGVADSFIDDMVTGVTRAEGSYPKQYKAGSERAKLYDELRGKITHASPGSLYKADLPDEMIDRMLDWDASIKSQPENVLKAVEPFMNKYGVARTADIGTLISAMEREMPSSMVSEKLRGVGIPGIKYKDAGSRGKGGTGTRNFVVFPGEEKKVRILERDGQKAPPQKIAQALEAANPITTSVEIPEALHGSPFRGLKELSPSKAMEVRGTTWFSDNPEIADQYTFPREYGEILYDAEPGEIYKASLSFKNPLTVDFSGKVGDARELSKLVEQAKKQGYDGLIIRNVDDSIDSSKVLGTSYAVFDRNQIKLKK